MRILFIQNRPLFPADTGGKIRTLNILRHLARWHEVTYLCNVAPGEDGALTPMAELGLRVEALPRSAVRRGSTSFWVRVLANLASTQPLSIEKNFDRHLKRRSQELVKREPYDLIICDFLHTARYARDLPGVPKVLFQHNVEAQILQRHAEQDKGRLRRAYMRNQWARMRAFEHRAGGWFDVVIAVSERDRATFQREYGWDHVHAIDTAVDLDYFSPHPAPVKEDHCLFVGSLDWLPNADGVTHFVRDVWPHLRARRPRASFSIVGRNPSAAVMRLGNAAGVEVIGRVPDVRPHLAAAAVVVVPLHVGGGTRLKIFEAMAMGKAVVSTSLGAEGLSVENGRHLLIADDPGQFADCVARLLGDEVLRQRIGAAALSLVRQHFGSEVIARQFEEICRETVLRQSCHKAPAGTAPAFDRLVSASV